jgi:hypothetical protein
MPLSAAFATGDTLETCALPTGCVEVPAPGPVDEISDEGSEAAGKVVKDTKETTDKATGGWTEPVTDPVVDEIADTLGLNPGTDPATGKTKKKKRNGTQGATDTSDNVFAPRSAAAAAAYDSMLATMAAREGGRALDDQFDRAVSFAPPATPDLAERLAQAALEAAKAFTFPAILIGMMVGFVLVQNRIDHKDPKLAFAPVSSEQDYLSFT